MPTVAIHKHRAEAGCDMSCEKALAIAVTLEIDNHYEDGESVQTTVQALIPAPPSRPATYQYDDPEQDEYDEWEWDYIFPLTGTGKEDGDSAYFVTVIASSRPDLIPVGTEYEF